MATTPTKTLQSDVLPEDRASPFINVFKRIREEMVADLGEDAGAGRIGGGLRSTGWYDDYNAIKDVDLDDIDESDRAVPMGEIQAEFWNGHDPEKDTDTPVKSPGNPWVHEDQYYFELASFHTWESSPDGCLKRDVGTGHRAWINPSTIHETIVQEIQSFGDFSGDPKELLAKKIEFLMQILQMTYLSNRWGVEKRTSRHINPPGKNASKDFLNIPSSEGSTDETVAAWCFTTQDRNSSNYSGKGSSTIGHAGKSTIFEHRVLGDLSTSLGQTSMSAGQQRDWDPSLLDDLFFYRRLQKGHDDGDGCAPHAYESWGINITFEGFLFYLAQLINYLDTAYVQTDVTKSDKSHDASQDIHALAGTKQRPVFMAGIPGIFYPRGSNASGTEIDKYFSYAVDGGEAGYTELTFSEIDAMLTVVNSDQVLIPLWLRDWWNNALTVSSGRSVPDWAGMDPGSPNPLMLGADGSLVSAADEAAPPTFDGSYGALENPVDPDACVEEVVAEEEPPCASCIPNPTAIVPNWTNLKPRQTFLNEKECKYSAIVVTEYETPPEEWREILTKYTEDPYLEAGINLLLDTYKKSKFITVIYADGTEISANTVDILMGRESATMYLGSAAADVPRASLEDIYVSPIPLIRMKALVTIPAELFDLIPVDLSDITGAVTPEVSTYVQLKAPDVWWMVWQISRAFKIYAKQYAAYIHEMNYDGQEIPESFGDLDLNKESDNFKYFREDLSLILKHHGFNYKIAELIKIGFKEDDGSSNWKPYQIEYIEVNEPGCAPILLDRPTWEEIIRDSEWNNTRTLGYIAKFPDIWTDIRAMIFPEWNEIAAKYTYGILESEDLLEGLPEDALECFVNDVLTDPLNAIMNEIADDVFAFPDAISNKFNKMLCSGEEFDRIDNWLEEIEGLSKRAYDASMREAFEGDPVYEILDYMFKEMKGGSSIREIYKKFEHKFGWCGILALIDMILGCLLKGVPTEDGLAIIIRAALKALGPLELEKLFLGLPPDKQAEIAAAVAEATNQITATPPWENEYQPGNYSFGPEKAGLLQTAKMKSSGKSLFESGATIESLAAAPEPEKGDSNATQASYYAFYLGTLDSEDSNYVSPEELQFQLAEHFPDEYGGKSFQAKGYSGVGTIGSAADDVLDVIFEAYTDVIFDLVDIDLLTESLQMLPGGAFIGSILSTLKCAIPPLINPPLDDFMKTLELDFCNGNYHITLPDIHLPNLNWLDILNLLKQAVLEAIQNLIIKAIFMLIKFILDLLLTGLCKLLGVVGDLLEAALSDNFRETFRNALCGDESNPTSQITDEQIDQSVASMLSVLSGCPTPTNAAATALISDLSAILMDAELIALLNGEATPDVLAMIQEVIEYRHPEFACALNSTGAISDLFNALGALIPPQYKTLPRSTPMPILPAYCTDQSSVEDFYDKQCILLSRKGPLTEEMCNEIINGIQDRAKQDIETLTDIAQNGLLNDLLPEVFADNPQCPGTWNAGIFPRNDPAVMSDAAEISEAIFDSLETLSQQDMVNGHGVLNMILAAKNGSGFRKHVFNLSAPVLKLFTPNKIPTSIAGHLKDRLENFNDNVSFETTNVSVLREAHWGADEPPSFFINERKFSARCYPTNMDIIPDWFDPIEGVVSDIATQGNSISGVWYLSSLVDSAWPQPTNLYKNPDLKLEFEDYKADQAYSFTLDYNNFQVDAGTSILNDYFKVLIRHQAKAGSDSEEGADLEDGSYVWYEGFTGEGKTETEVRGLVDDASEGYRIIDIDDKLARADSPKNAIYHELIRGSWEEPLDWIESDLAAPIQYSSAKEDSYYATSYTQYDYIYTILINRVAKFIGGGKDAFEHGFSENYRGPVDENDLDYSALIGDEFGPDDAENLLQPIKVQLSGSHTDKTGMDWTIPPEVYGGTSTRNAYYILPPDYGGWMGIKQTLIPEQIYTGCEESEDSLADFGGLKRVVDDLYERLPDDSRLTESKHCAMEHPWNKILDRYSSSGIEATIRATIRIYVLEAMIRGMASFTLFEGKFPENFDDSFSAHIADTIEDGLIEQTRGTIFRDPLLYYLTFMEQIVQSFGKRMDLGDFIPTNTEQEAIDRLTGKASKPNKLNQKYWEENDFITIGREMWPGQVSAGIMAGVGSVLGPAGAVAGAIIGGGGSVIAAKNKKKAIWKRYVSHPDNLRDSKILLRRFIKDEMEYMSKRFNKEYEPAVDSLVNLFLVDPGFIMGALDSPGGAGPLSVASVDDGTSNPTIEKIHDYIYRKYVPLGQDGSYESNGVSPTIGLNSFWGKETVETTTTFGETETARVAGTGEQDYWPFVLEKYIKITERETLGFTMRAADAEIFFRKDKPWLTGIVSFEDWNAWVVENADILDGVSIDQLFEKWEVGLRVCHLSKDDPQATGGYDLTITGTEQSVAEISMKTKAYRMQDDQQSADTQWKYLMPIATAERTIDSTGMIPGTASNLDNIFKDQIDCLVKELTEHPRYKLMFEYCFSLPRILSILTIYNMKAFMPSIGSVEHDDWEKRVFGDDADLGGGKFQGPWPWGGFRTWDWNDLFKKSKKQARRVFETFYNATDLESKTNDKSEFRRLRNRFDINLNFNFGWLSWLLKMRRRTPFNKDGAPCPLIDEES